MSLLLWIVYDAQWTWKNILAQDEQIACWNIFSQFSFICWRRLCFVLFKLNENVLWNNLPLLIFLWRTTRIGARITKITCTCYIKVRSDVMFAFPSTLKVNIVPMVTAFFPNCCINCPRKQTKDINHVMFANLRKRDPWSWVDVIVIMTAVNKNMLSGKASHCFISKIVDRSTSLIGQLFPFIFFCRNGSKFSVGICVQKKPLKCLFYY